MTTWDEFMHTLVPPEVLHSANDGNIELISATLINIYLERAAQAVKDKIKPSRSVVHDQYLMENLAYRDAADVIRSLKIDIA